MRKPDYTILLFWALKLLRTIGRHTPEPVFHRFGRAAAVAVFAVLPGKRENIRRNLRVALRGTPANGGPTFERRVRRLARRCMATYGEILLDFVAYDRLLPLVWRDTETAKGWEHIDRALVEGRGVVFVTAHFGHWDMAGAALARHVPCKVFAVAESFAHQELNRMVIEQRASYGMDIVPMDDVRQMRRVLRDGNILGILADRPARPGEGVSVSFFGVETRFPAGAATLASLARCPIIVGGLHRTGGGRFTGIILPPIEPVRTGNREQDIARTMQAVARDLETIVRRSPHHWFMFREMWPSTIMAGNQSAAATARPAFARAGSASRMLERTRRALGRLRRLGQGNRPRLPTNAVETQMLRRRAVETLPV